MPFAYFAFAVLTAVDYLVLVPACLSSSDLPAIVFGLLMAVLPVFVLCGYKHLEEKEKDNV